MTPEEHRRLTELVHSLTLKNPDLNFVLNGSENPWFIQEYQRLLQALENRSQLILPNLRDRNQTIGVFSDYSGENKESNHYTYSFLVCAWNQTQGFNDFTKVMRDKHGLSEPFKEISFKDFRYGPISRCLDEYLRGADGLINGFLLTVVIDKNAPSIAGGTKAGSKKLAEELARNGYPLWKPTVAEKLARIVHFSAYLVALLSSSGQKIFWMTDHDSIASDEAHHRGLLDFFSDTLEKYSKHSYAKIGGATPFQEKDHGTLDLLSLSDITAGSVEHFLSKERTNFSSPPKEEALKVIRWLCHDGLLLRKHMIRIKLNNGVYETSTLKFIDNSPLSSSTTIIPIVY